MALEFRNCMTYHINLAQMAIINLNSSSMTGKLFGTFVPDVPLCICMPVGISIQRAVWCLPNLISSWTVAYG